MKFRKDVQKVGESKDIHVAISQKGIEISRKGEPISGLVPELVELDFRCGVNRKDFRIIVEKQQNIRGRHYKVTQVLKVENLPKSKTASNHKAKNLDINVEEIEGISTFQCPHCRGGKSAVLQCGCGGLSCGGGIRSEGNKEYHECPWCGSIGVIEDHIKTLSGERSPLRETLTVRDTSKQALKITDYSAKMLRSGDKKITKS
ncbi:TerY-C metal binding domain-containing protein [Chloroflexota bacterium]